MTRIKQSIHTAALLTRDPKAILHDDIAIRKDAKSRKLLR